MLGILVKKQFSETFKNYFYDAKKNKMRSKGAIAAWIVFFLLLMLGVLGGSFTALSFSLCGPLTMVGLDWLYFLVMCPIAVVLGAFGSVFNTYSSLYLGKDNDLLLSLPIPVRTIIAARLVNVYLLGAMYSAVVMLPTLIVYWLVAGATAARVICGVLLLIGITVIVLLLSCLLGWVVAKVSQKLKRKSYLSTLAALVFVGLYYFVYFKARVLIAELIRNAEVYGAKISGAARGLYLFGRVGTGDWMATAVFVAVTAILSALVWRLLRRSFLKIATDSGSGGGKVRYRETAVKAKSAFAALLGKEFGRFTSSANYMLNCGLGVLVLTAGGVVLLIKGQALCAALEKAFPARPGSTVVLLCTLLLLASSMNDMATPAVSLEGKCLWIPQSLPVEPKTVLRAKAAAELILTGIPMLIAAVCAAIIVPATPTEKLLLALTALLYAVFSSFFDAVIGVKMPILNWTNEMAPIKQSGGALIAIFGSWLFCVAFAGLWLFVGYRLGAAVWLAIWCVVFALGALLLRRWLDTKGAAIFAAL